MKVLIISGSPKSEGLIHSLVQAAFETAKGAGAETEILKLTDHKIEQCRLCKDGWGSCRTEHVCVSSDEFNSLQTKFEESDAFVYITPVYWGDMTEIYKVFFDKLRRCQATKRWNEDENIKSFLTDKPSIIAASAGGSGNGIINTFTQIERMIGHMAGDGMPKDKKGIFDYIAVNRWNKDYKIESLKAAVKQLVNNLK